MRKLIVLAALAVAVSASSEAQIIKVIDYATVDGGGSRTANPLLANQVCAVVTLTGLDGGVDGGSFTVTLYPVDPLNPSVPAGPAQSEVFTSPTAPDAGYELCDINGAGAWRVLYQTGGYNPLWTGVTLSMVGTIAGPGLPLPGGGVYFAGGLIDDAGVEAPCWSMPNGFACCEGSNGGTGNCIAPDGGVVSLAAGATSIVIGPTGVAITGPLNLDGGLSLAGCETLSTGCSFCPTSPGGGTISAFDGGFVALAAGATSLTVSPSGVTLSPDDGGVITIVGEPAQYPDAGYVDRSGQNTVPIVTVPEGRRICLDQTLDGGACQAWLAVGFDVTGGPPNPDGGLSPGAWDVILNTPNGAAHEFWVNGVETDYFDSFGNLSFGGPLMYMDARNYNGSPLLQFQEGLNLVMDPHELPLYLTQPLWFDNLGDAGVAGVGGVLELTGVNGLSWMNHATFSMFQAYYDAPNGTWHTYEYGSYDGVSGLSVFGGSTPAEIYGTHGLLVDHNEEIDGDGGLFVPNGNVVMADDGVHGVTAPGNSCVMTFSGSYLVSMTGCQLNVTALVPATLATDTISNPGTGVPWLTAGGSDPQMASMPGGLTTPVVDAGVVCIAGVCHTSWSGAATDPYDFANGAAISGPSGGGIDFTSPRDGGFDLFNVGITDTSELTTGLAEPLISTCTNGSGSGTTWDFLVTALGPMGNEETWTSLSNMCELSTGATPNVILGWAAVPGAVSYNVYGTVSPGAPQWIENTTSTTVSLSAGPAAITYTSPTQDLSGAVCAGEQTGNTTSVDAGVATTCMSGYGGINDSISTFGLYTLAVGNQGPPTVAINSGSGSSTSYCVTIQFLSLGGGETACTAGVVTTVSGGATPNNNISYASIYGGDNFQMNVYRVSGGSGQGLIASLINPKPGVTWTITDNNRTAVSGSATPLVNTTGWIDANGPVYASKGIWFDSVGTVDIYKSGSTLVADAGAIELAGAAVPVITYFDGGAITTTTYAWECGIDQVGASWTSASVVLHFSSGTPACQATNVGTAAALPTIEIQASTLTHTNVTFLSSTSASDTAISYCCLGLK